METTAPDPGGGPAWAVRTWRPAAEPNDRPLGRWRIFCMQAGRLIGGRLFRTFESGPPRRMRLGDRTVCFDGIVPIINAPLVAIERLADDPETPRRLVRTIVAGFVPIGAGNVRLAVRGEERPVPFDIEQRTFLVVLDGSVRRSDLVLTTDAGRPHVDDFGQSYGTTPGPLELVQVPDPFGGPPFALARYALGDQRCIESGRVIAGEVGSYDSRWGSFLDAPTLVGVPLFVDRWAPTRPIGNCPQAPGSDRVWASLQRYDDRVAVLEGTAGPLVRTLRLIGPDGTTRPVSRSGDVFIAATPMTGALNERAVLVATLADGSRRRRHLFLGPRDVPIAWDTHEVRGRVLRVRWYGPPTPFSGADVRFRTAGTAVVTIYVRTASSFEEDTRGSYDNLADRERCADIVLPRPLGGRRVVPGWPGRAERGPRNHPRRFPQSCPRVRAGSRLDVDWDTRVGGP